MSHHQHSPSKDLSLVRLQHLPAHPGALDELIIADGTAPEILELLEGATAPVVALGAHQSPAAVLQTITTVLAGWRVKTLHIVAHGQPGAFCLGGQLVDAKAVREGAPLLVQWGVEEVALWSCLLGSNSALVRHLTVLTGAKVYATDSTLGASPHGPKWRLTEDHQESLLPLNQEVADQWPHQLVSLLFSAVAYFAEDSSASGSAKADLEENSLKLLGVVNGPAAVKFLFTSDPATAPIYSGNNVRGTLYAIDSSNNVVGVYYGEISRLIKSGSTVQAGQMYVYPTADPTVTGNPAQTILIDFGTGGSFSTGSTVGTSSDPVDASLNKLIPAIPAPRSSTVQAAHNAP